MLKLSAANKENFIREKVRLKSDLFNKFDLNSIEEMFQVKLDSNIRKVIFLNCLNIITANNKVSQNNNKEELFNSINAMISQKFDIVDFFSNQESFKSLDKLCTHTNSAQKHGLFGSLGIGDYKTNSAIKISKLINSLLDDAEKSKIINIDQLITQQTSGNAITDFLILTSASNLLKYIDNQQHRKILIQAINSKNIALIQETMGNILFHSQINPTEVIKLNGVIFKINGKLRLPKNVHLIDAKVYKGEVSIKSGDISAEASGAIALANGPWAIANANVSGAVAWATKSGAIARANERGAIAMANVSGAEAWATKSGANAIANEFTAKAWATVLGAEAWATKSGASAIANAPGAIARATVFSASVIANAPGAIAWATVLGAIAEANAFDAIANAFADQALAMANILGAKAVAYVNGAVAWAAVFGAIAEAKDNIPGAIALIYGANLRLANLEWANLRWDDSQTDIALQDLDSMNLIQTYKTRLNNNVQRNNYEISDIRALIRNFIERIDNNNYLNTYTTNDNEEINIENYPTPTIEKIVSFTITKEEFFTENKDYFLENFDEYQKKYLVDNKYIIDNIPEDLNQALWHDNQNCEKNIGHVINAKYNRISISDDDAGKIKILEEKINNNIKEIETVYVLINHKNEQISKERYDNLNKGINNTNSLALYDGMLMVHDRYYDREKILELLVAIKEENEELFITTIAKIIAGLPTNLSEQKSAFQDTFTHLFVTGNFPSAGLKLTYHHFLGRCGQIH